MGSFPGHAMSGISFLLLATIWTIKRIFNSAYTKYQRAGRRGDKKLQTFRKIPLEGILVFVAGIGGIIGEQTYQGLKLRLFDDDGVVVYTDVWQHCTMYAGFVIYGAVKIAVGTYFINNKKWENVFLTFAYFVECMLFYFHLHGRTELNIRLHELEVVAVFLCVLFSAGEIWLERDQVLPWLRIWATFLQGSWMLQIGSTLYHPLRSKDYSWDENDHLNIKLFSMIFVWHCFLGIIIVAVLVSVIKISIRWLFGEVSSSYTGINNEEDNHHHLSMKLRKNGCGGEECIVYGDDILRSDEE